jgi:virginiamycin B lyase
MDRRGFHRGLVLTALTPAIAGSTRAAASISAQDQAAPVVHHRTITEYVLPAAKQTHELVKLPGAPLVLVSQQAPSQLVKLWLDPTTERVTGVRAFPSGPEDAMLHGLALSTVHPGLVWATHEAGNRLLLVDPGAADLDTPPTIVRTIDVPGGGRGPHYVGEYQELLWVSLKGSDQVLAINHTDPRQYWLYEAEPHPIFVARHPDTGEFYASQDESSMILRIDHRTKSTTQLPIPVEAGSTPVGLVAGPTAVWVTVLGTAEQGSGTFGRIDGHGAFTWLRLTSPQVKRAGLLHIALEAPPARRGPSAWLLGSSIISPNALDVIIRVTFDNPHSRILGEEVAVLPTQLCKAHRVLPLTTSVLTTELASATVAQLVTEPGSSWHQPTTAAPQEPS